MQNIAHKSWEKLFKCAGLDNNNKFPAAFGRWGGDGEEVPGEGTFQKLLLWFSLNFWLQVKHNVDVSLNSAVLKMFVQIF